MSQLDEAEYERLASQVLEIEKLLRSGPPRDGDFLLRNFVSNAKSRMEEIRHEDQLKGESKKEQKEREAAVAVQLAEMEHSLSAREKQQYSGFMQLEYFRKADFEKLEEFYADSWDRLSEGGKNQMSVRVWGGIRRHEYMFEELPDKIREKESERIYLQLTGAIEPSATLNHVAPQARAEFIREYEAGNEKAATRILSGGNFAEYSPDSPKKLLSHEASLSAAIRPEERTPEKIPQTGKSGEASLDGLTLDPAGSVPATGLALSGSKGMEKN